MGHEHQSGHGLEAVQGQPVHGQQSPAAGPQGARASAIGLPAGSARVTLRPTGSGDEAEFLRLVHASARLHHPWMSLPATPEDFQAYLRRFEQSGLGQSGLGQSGLGQSGLGQSGLKQPSAESLLVCVRDTGAIAGMVNISNIIRGRFQCGSLSYAAFAPTAGLGYMTEEVGLAVRHAFEQLQLHRLEANIQPGNHPSLSLVQRLGFRREGYSPEMLFIDGAWRDHERWAITATMTGTVADPHPSMPRH